MNGLEPRRVPDDVTEISYTARDGSQVAIALEDVDGGRVARPASPADLEALDRLGFTDVAPEPEAVEAEESAPRRRGKEQS